MIKHKRGVALLTNYLGSFTKSHVTRYNDFVMLLLTHKYLMRL